MNAPAFVLEVDHHIVDDGLGERSLWCAAMALLLDDARRWHNTGKDPQGVADGTGARALRDVLVQGPMIQHLCRHADQDVVWVCERFARSLSPRIS